MRTNDDKLRKRVYTEKDREYARKRWQTTRRFLDSVKITEGCIDCGDRENSTALEFDHKTPRKETNMRTVNQATTWPKLAERVVECDVRCANCHRIKTYAN